jgi:hypothetical protein
MMILRPRKRQLRSGIASVPFQLKPNRKIWKAKRRLPPAAQSVPMEIDSNDAKDDTKDKVKFTKTLAYNMTGFVGKLSEEMQSDIKRLVVISETPHLQVTSIELINNPNIMDAFENKCAQSQAVNYTKDCRGKNFEEFQKTLSKSLVRSVTVHGTPSQNVESICSEGFKFTDKSNDRLGAGMIWSSDCGNTAEHYAYKYQFRLKRLGESFQIIGCRLLLTNDKDQVSYSGIKLDPIYFAVHYKNIVPFAIITLKCL